MGLVKKLNTGHLLENGSAYVQTCPIQKWVGSFDYGQARLRIGSNWILVETYTAAWLTLEFLDQILKRMSYGQVLGDMLKSFNSLCLGNQFIRIHVIFHWPIPMSAPSVRQSVVRVSPGRTKAGSLSDPDQKRAGKRPRTSATPMGDCVWQAL